MQKSPIQVGSIDLQDFEVPQSVRFGGRHRLVVHTLAGGGRSIERLGPDDADIQFSGTFSGSFAETRARALDNLRVSGDIIWLTWESFRREVIVKSFLADYVNPWWIPYQISCVVVHQPSNVLSEVFDMSAMLTADLGNARAAATGFSVPLAPLQNALSMKNAFIANTADQVAAVIAARSVFTAVGDQMNYQSAILDAREAPRTSAAQSLQSFSSRVDSAAALAAMTITRSYIGRMGANLTRSGN